MTQKGCNGQFVSRVDPVVRFWSKVLKVNDSCWLWTDSKATRGYGVFWYAGKQMPAHRFSYLLKHGAIPEGLELDHLCRNRACVNPDHLEPVTGKENILRGNSLPAINFRKTHCSKGHPYDEQNTYRHNNGAYRRCRTCDIERRKRYRSTPHRLGGEKVKTHWHLGYSNKTACGILAYKTEVTDEYDTAWNSRIECNRKPTCKLCQRVMRIDSQGRSTVPEPEVKP